MITCKRSYALVAVAMISMLFNFGWLSIFAYRIAVSLSIMQRCGESGINIYARGLRLDYWSDNIIAYWNRKDGLEFLLYDRKSRLLHHVKRSPDNSAEESTSMNARHLLKSPICELKWKESSSGRCSSVYLDYNGHSKWLDKNGDGNFVCIE